VLSVFPLGTALCCDVVMDIERPMVFLFCLFNIQVIVIALHR